MTTPLFPSVIAWNVLDGGTDAQDGNNYPGPALQDYADAVVGAAGISLEYGDSLTRPSNTTTLTAAISTTATLSATATSTYRKARVSWLNNGASGTANLYISVNAENDVQGLVACNNARRRDHEMTIGDCIMLVCDEPITRLNFTSDTSISSNTHRLVITFGE